MKSSYELRTNDEDKEGGATLSDDDEGSDAESDSSDSRSSDNGHDDDDRTPTMKAIIVKTMIVNTVAMIGVNPLMIENIKIMGSIMKSMMMM